ncbi:MAG: hypothetical protein JWM23_757 [Microbacteriaceae bacterium]|nr:hypothetical protein [Microbacteriaceae bacterium]
MPAGDSTQPLTLRWRTERRSARMRAAVTLACALASVLLSGCAAAALPGAAYPTEQPAASAVPASQVAVGECVNASADTLLRDLTLVDCASEHDWEVYSVTRIPGEEYPGDDAAAAAAEAGCASAFEPFAGIPYERSALDYAAVTPDSAAWDDGDQSAVCLVGDSSGRVGGSLAGAGR